MARDQRFDEPGAVDERSARGLVGGGPSQVRGDQATRVRDAHRPSEQDLAEAEDTVRVVHRNWRPSTP